MTPYKFRRCRPLLLALPALLTSCGNSQPQTLAAVPITNPAPLPTPAPIAKDVLSCSGAVGGINLQTATVLELQAALRSGQISSERLVQQSLDRIEAFDRSGPKLNAIRALAPTALAQAREADAASRSPPIHFGFQSSSMA